VPEKPLEHWDLPSGGGYLEEYQDFYQACRKGGQPRSTFSEAAKDLNTMLKAIEGAKK